MTQRTRNDWKESTVWWWSEVSRLLPPWASPEAWASCRMPREPHSTSLTMTMSQYSSALVEMFVSTSTYSSSPQLRRILNSGIKVKGLYYYIMSCKFSCKLSKSKNFSEGICQRESRNRLPTRSPIILWTEEQFSGGWEWSAWRHPPGRLSWLLPVPLA